MRDTGGCSRDRQYFERLSDEDRQVFVDGFGVCVQPKVYATLLTQGLDNALFPLGDAGAVCVVDRIGTDRTTAELASMALSDQDATAGVVAEAVSTCVSAPELQAGLAAHLVRVDGLDDTAASCVAGRLIDGSASAELLGQLLLRAGGRGGSSITHGDDRERHPNLHLTLNGWAIPSQYNTHTSPMQEND